MQDSLGAKAGGGGPVARTLFFVNISPEAQHFPETMCTLRFAEKLKSVEMNANTASSASSGSAANTSVAAAAGGDVQVSKRPKRAAAAK